MKTTTPENKGLKTLKGQLFGAVSMMLVAAIALGTSTYAWFINNRTVEVKDMQLTVSTSTSLLVAIGKHDTDAATVSEYTGYKTVVTNGDIDGKGTAVDPANWSEFFKFPMIPATITTASLKTTTPAFFATNNHVANSKLDEFLTVSEGLTAADLSQGAVKRLPLKFSSSNDLNVYFGKDGLGDIADMVSSVNAAKTQDAVNAITDATEKAAAQTALNQALAIRAALRVAVVPRTDPTNYTGTTLPVVLQFNNGASVAVGAKNNTDYQYVADGKVFGADGTAYADTAADALTNIQKETEGKYAAIKAVDGSTKRITEVGLLQAALPTAKGTGYLSTVTAAGDVTKPDTSATYLFQLKAAKERAVDVYIWLEGTDQDCLNELSGYKFNLVLPFAGADTTT